VPLSPAGPCACDRDLAGVADLGVVASRQVIDVPLAAATVTQYNGHAVACACGRVHGAPGDDLAPGRRDTCRHGPDLAATVAALSGPDWRCAGATDDELTGLLGRWNALESWAAAAKLGVTRELIRRRGLRGAGSHGDLPDAWDDSLDHELTPALAISLPAAGNLANLSWELGARLPGIGAALANGTIDYRKAQLIVKELTVLDDAHIAEAEAMILPELAGKTPGELTRLAALAVDTVDPEGARKRRERAEREDARVRVWREHTGASAMAAYGLPADAALAASANINQRGTCTFPGCSRHARESDFEHAVPYRKGGKTRACNAGARSRRCHRVEQAKGWTLTQPRPGWHEWTTPGGRVYTRGPMKYPA
jgi:hypothetical protein